MQCTDIAVDLLEIEMYSHYLRQKVMWLNIGLSKSCCVQVEL